MGHPDRTQFLSRFLPRISAAQLDQWLFKLKFIRESKLISQIRKQNLTYCGYPKLENICWAIDEVQKLKIPGIYIEAGCALGGSAILIGTMKPKPVPFYIYDVFDMIPSPSIGDGPDAHARYKEIIDGQSKGLGNDVYYGYVENLKDVVIGNMRRCGLNTAEYNIHLMQGLFQQTMNPEEPVAFAHIDCDWYDSVTTCIERIIPKMITGSRIIFDDYHSYSGCKKAVDDFLVDNKEFKVSRVSRSLTAVKL